MIKVSTEWTTDEFAIMRALALQAPGMTFAQIAHGWFHHKHAAIEEAQRAVARLLSAGLIEARSVESHPLVPLERPLFSWKPGDSDPSLSRLSSTAQRARARWSAPLEAVTIYIASRFTARLFGAFLDAGRAKACEVTHNLHLSSLFIRYLTKRSKTAVEWIAEAGFPKLGFDIKGIKDPDAYLVTTEGKIERVIEVVGCYSEDHLAQFHRHCAGRGAAQLVRFAAGEKRSWLAQMYAPQGTAYELW